MKILTLFLAAVLLSLTSRADALEYDTGYTGGNCSNCSWISADGEIEEGDAARLAEFITAEGIEYQKLLIINSPGGNVAAALELGSFLREKRMRIIVGETQQSDAEFAGHKTQTYDAGVCASACVFVLMSGVQREIAEGSQIGVHQFAPVSDEYGSVATTTSSAQTMMAALQGYTIMMGVDPGVLTLASLRKPNEMMWLEVRTSEQLNLLTSRSFLEFPDWSLEPFGGQLIGKVAQEQSNGRTTVYMVDCRYLYAAFEVSSSRTAEIADSIMGANIQSNTREGSYALEVVNVSADEQRVILGIVAGPRILNWIAAADDDFHLDIDLPHVYWEEFGGVSFAIPSSNLADIAPHVTNSCR